jgi:hypothetical protein
MSLLQSSSQNFTNISHRRITLSTKTNASFYAQCLTPLPSAQYMTLYNHARIINVATTRNCGSASWKPRVIKANCLKRILIQYSTFKKIFRIVGICLQKPKLLGFIDINCL